MNTPNKRPLEDYVGHCYHVEFTAKYNGEMIEREVLWVSIVSAKDGVLVGEVRDHSMKFPALQYGDYVKVLEEQIQYRG